LTITNIYQIKQEVGGNWHIGPYPKINATPTGTFTNQEAWWYLLQTKQHIEPDKREMMAQDLADGVGYAYEEKKIEDLHNFIIPTLPIPWTPKHKPTACLLVLKSRQKL